jgi:hypothetical protein
VGDSPYIYRTKHSLQILRTQKQTEERKNRAIKLGKNRKSFPSTKTNMRNQRVEKPSQSNSMDIVQLWSAHVSLFRTVNNSACWSIPIDCRKYSARAWYYRYITDEAGAPPSLPPQLSCHINTVAKICNSGEAFRSGSCYL